MPSFPGGRRLPFFEFIAYYLPLAGHCSPPAARRLSYRLPPPVLASPPAMDFPRAPSAFCGYWKFPKENGGLCGGFLARSGKFLRSRGNFSRPGGNRFQARILRFSRIYFRRILFFHTARRARVNFPPSPLFRKRRRGALESSPRTRRP